MIARFMTILPRILTLVIAAAAPIAAQAHPHVWVTFESELIFAPDGALTGVRHAWSFDDMFSTFATQGIEAKAKGAFTREELAPLADVNVQSLKEYDYFTYVTADGNKAELTDPAKGEYWLEFKDSVLTLHFTLPLKQPVKVKALAIDIYDTSIFIDFAFAKDRPVRLVNAPPGCKGTIELPREMTYAEGKALSQIPADEKNTAMAWGANFANKIRVNCP
jgi:ABC-type uncharacterized transport system substrate-binding protein